MVKKACLLVIAFTCLFLMFGCGSDPDVQQVKLKKTEPEKKRSLTLYNWQDYIGSNTLANFEKETGIKVNLEIFESEEEMLGSTQSDSGWYDLVVTSDDTARELREAKLLLPLSYDKIPNFKHINNKYINQSWDPAQDYSVPYLVGTTGIVVNTKYIKNFQRSWKLFFDKRYAGKMALLDEPFEAIATVSKALGYALNELDSEAISNIERKFNEIAPLLHGFYVIDEMIKQLRDEEIWLAHSYSGEAMVLIDENDAFEYIIPEEGAPIWVDVFVMPKNARNVEEAHQFLNYILRPEVNAAIASELWYATANKSAEKLIDPEVLSSPVVYPPPEVLKRCEMFHDTGIVTREYNRLWAQLRQNLKTKLTD